MSQTAKRRKKNPPLGRVIAVDILIGALILALYMFIKFALPILSAKPVASSPVQQPTPAPVEETAPVTPQPTEETPAPVEETPEPTPEPTPDTRTEWQKAFAEHFTDEVVITDHSYTSPEVSINIETRTLQANRGETVVHIADIYIASIDNFKTATANNELKYFSVEDVMNIDAASHAILAISGDLYAYQASGLLMRNGVLYRNDPTGCDVCVLYANGVLATYRRGSFSNQDILDADPLQIWNFGPALLDENGQAYPSFQVSTAVGYPNPRSAVGYYEPGHYCFVVVDGRQEGYSAGLLIPELAQLFQELGCTSAYNLDGGGSAVMTFMHEKYSRQSNGADRALSDILLITEESFGAQEGGEA